METLTPMLKQYLEIKEKYKDCILFFRLGDFYEMFYDDAKKASKILDLVLTSRSGGKSGKVPMCGIPYHAAENYINRLIKANCKIAICEQIEDPSLAQGIVKRDVIRVITSGTFIDQNNSSSRYIIALKPGKNTIAIAFTDITSTNINTNQYRDLNNIVGIISKLPIYEAIYDAEDEKTIKEILNHPLVKAKNISLTARDPWNFNLDIAKDNLNKHFKTLSLKGFGIENLPQAITASSALLEYLKEMNKQNLQHIHKISLYTDNDYVHISPSAIKGLELELLIKNIDNTLTPMGKRNLQHWIYHPLKDVTKISERQQAINLLKENPQIQKELSLSLNNTPDIEKSLSRISCGYAHAKDLLAIRNTLIKIPDIKKSTRNLSERNILFTLKDPEKTRKLLEKAIDPDLSLSNPDTTIIKKGFNQELDQLLEIKETAKEWLRNFQKKEIERTGINSLKIGFNQIFGYYIEITKANLNLVPSDYIRKQTLVNSERFLNEALKDFEEKILSADAKISKIEKNLVAQIQEKILSDIFSLTESISNLSTIDSIYSLTQVALRNGYTMPKISNTEVINIKDGKHPLVENLLNQEFIPNDTLLDCKSNHMLIITGPNMSGKSTYIRQVALLVIMAQIGSYIPASSANIGVVDKIFTRIGSHDDITKGQSTFMVEMTETAYILNNISKKSLVILDEIGRGTSTFDGLSLAWAIAEYLTKLKIRSLFATHFHELTTLSQEYEGAKNYNVAVKEWEDEIVFLHKIIPGSTDDSYGIYVGKIAGIPKEVISRAKRILTQLELNSNLKEKIKNISNPQIQLDLFSKQTNPTLEKIAKEIKSLNLNNLTPIDALKKIDLWQKNLLKDK